MALFRIFIQTGLSYLPLPSFSRRDNLIPGLSYPGAYYSLYWLNLFMFMSWLLNKKILGTLVLLTLSLTHTGAFRKKRQSQKKTTSSHPVVQRKLKILPPASSLLKGRSDGASLSCRIYERACERKERTAASQRVKGCSEPTGKMEWAEDGNLAFVSYENVCIKQAPMERLSDKCNEFFSSVLLNQVLSSIIYVFRLNQILSSRDVLIDQIFGNFSQENIN